MFVWIIVGEMKMNEGIRRDISAESWGGPRILSEFQILKVYRLILCTSWLCTRYNIFGSPYEPVDNGQK